MATHGLQTAAPGTRGMTSAITAIDWSGFPRSGSLATVVLAHIVLFYLLQNGLSREAAPHAQPREVVVSFITPRPPAPQPAPQPAAPRTVPVVKKQIAPPRPAPQPVNPAPSQNTITAAPPEPAPAAPPAPPLPAPTHPSAPATPPAPSVPQTITSGIEYVQPPQPEYPPVSKRMGEEGKAVVRVLVNEKGRPEQAEVQRTSGSARLDEAARLAVLRAVFKPFMENGKAVAAYAIVPIRFQLN